MKNITHSKKLKIVALNLIGIALIYTISFCYGRQIEREVVDAKPMVKFSEEILEASEAHDVNPALIAAVIHAESNFNPKAHSHVGAQGLMQIMPATQRYLGCRNGWDPRQNINAGSKYLRELLNNFRGNMSLAIAAYNAGPGAVKKFSGIPPYKETRNYVKKVLNNYSRYQRLFASDPLIS